MKKISPVYINLLIAAAVIFVVGVCLMLSQFAGRIGEIEHRLLHIEGKHHLTH